MFRPVVFVGAGWYDYERPGAKKPYPSDFVKDLIADYRKRHGIVQRKISTQVCINKAQHLKL